MRASQVRVGQSFTRENGGTVLRRCQPPEFTLVGGCLLAIDHECKAVWVANCTEVTLVEPADPVHAMHDVARALIALQNDPYLYLAPGATKSVADIVDRIGEVIPLP